MAEQNSSGDGTEDRTALAEEQKEERLQVAEQEQREEGGTDRWWPRACQDAPRPLFSRAVSPLPPPSPPERDRVSESERERERETSLSTSDWNALPPREGKKWCASYRSGCWEAGPPPCPFKQK